MAVMLLYAKILDLNPLLLISPTTGIPNIIITINFMQHVNSYLINVIIKLNLKCIPEE